MVITDFAIASVSVDSTCRSDYVTISDGDGNLLMDKTCDFEDQVMPPPIMSSTNLVDIFFYSDNNGASRGWSVSWTTVTSGGKKSKSLEYT